MFLVTIPFEFISAYSLTRPPKQCVLSHIPICSIIEIRWNFLGVGGFCWILLDFVGILEIELFDLSPFSDLSVL